MKVTTDGVTIAVGVLIVASLSLAGLKTVRDENDRRDECEPQSSEMAGAAAEAFADKYVLSPPTEGTSSGSVFIVTSAKSAHDSFGTTTSLPRWTGSGYVVVADLDPEDDPELPTCFDNTPIVYVEDVSLVAE